MEQKNSQKSVRSCPDAGKEKFPSCTWWEVTLLAGHAVPHRVSRLSPMQLPASLYLAIMVWTCHRIISEEDKVLRACCQSPKCLCTPSPFYSEHLSSLAGAGPWPLHATFLHTLKGGGTCSYSSCNRQTLQMPVKHSGNIFAVRKVLSWFFFLRIHHI